MKTDIELLEACLAQNDIHPETEKAFKNMLQHLNDKPRAKLTAKQRSWVIEFIGETAKKTGVSLLDKSEEFEEGIVIPTEEEKKAMYEWLATLGPKPLKPPGVKVK